MKTKLLMPILFLSMASCQDEAQINGISEQKNLFSNTKTVENQLSNPMDDDNVFLLETLKNRLVELGFEAEQHPQRPALIINSRIEIITNIIRRPNSSENLLCLAISTIQPSYFPNGINEMVVGAGEDINEKVNSALDNYINTTFFTIIESFSDTHNPDLDFSTTIDDKEVLWHPKLGDLGFQGEWNNRPKNDVFFKILKDKLKSKLASNKLQWLKLYISKQADGTIMGECLFNNEPWEEGLAEIRKYAASWKSPKEFKGLKQFIMFRKCDAYGE